MNAVETTATNTVVARATDARATDRAAAPALSNAGAAERQDSVIARDALLEIAASAHAAGESAFTYGLMYAAECSRGIEAQHAYRAVLHTASSKKVRRWTQ
jgi:hypothetical protein